MRAVIQPSAARGAVAAPPSKSMAHRLLLCAALTPGTTLVRGVDPSEDILATADCLQALGAELTFGEGGAVTVRGCDPRKSGPAVLNCRESGSTLRFLLPLCLLSGNPMRMTGSEKLLSRPLSVYEEICRANGFTLEKQPDSLLVQGHLRPGEYTVPGDISSQFATGLLYALPLLDGASAIRLLPPVESRSYLSLTVQALRDAGIPVGWDVNPDGENIFTVPGGAAYTARNGEVEGDYSNAAFFEALNLTGGEVTVTGLRPDSLQGDRVYADYFARLRSAPAEALDIADCPDLAPVLIAAAALQHGAELTGTRRLRFKESDRGEAMAREMAKFGIRLAVGENTITVPDACPAAPYGILSSHNDHRIAMALAVLCTRTGGTIDGAEAVRKSFPDFWERLRSLGVKVSLSD